MGCSDSFCPWPALAPQAELFSTVRASWAWAGKLHRENSYLEYKRRASDTSSVPASLKTLPEAQRTQDIASLT